MRKAQTEQIWSGLPRIATSALEVPLKSAQVGRIEPEIAAGVTCRVTQRGLRRDHPSRSDACLGGRPTGRRPLSEHAGSMLALRGARAAPDRIYNSAEAGDPGTTKGRPSARPPPLNITLGDGNVGQLIHSGSVDARVGRKGRERRAKSPAQSSLSSRRSSSSRRRVSAERHGPRRVIRHDDRCVHFTCLDGGLPDARGSHISKLNGDLDARIGAGGGGTQGLSAGAP